MYSLFIPNICCVALWGLCDLRNAADIHSANAAQRIEKIVLQSEFKTYRLTLAHRDVPLKLIHTVIPKTDGITHVKKSA